MRKILMLMAICASAAALYPLASIGGEKKRFANDVSEWSSLTAPAPDVIPVGGSGQVNGDFVVSERNGIQLGIRAQRRFLQNVDPLPSDRVGNVGVYGADTGTSDGLGRAT